ncbi:MAG: DUF192 domain-containing protein [Sphingomonadaceae bacterium]
MLAATFRIASAAFALALTPVPLQAVQPLVPAARPNEGLAIVPLSVTTRTGTHRYRVEVAKTALEQQIGMMYRTDVPRGTGMLFPYDPPRPAAFWMENTFVGLDIIFIAPDGRVSDISARAVPMSRDLHQSSGKVKAVLELAAGEAERIGLRVGDRVAWESHALGNGKRGR